MRRQTVKKTAPFAIGALLILVPLTYFLVKNNVEAEAAWWTGDGVAWTKRKQLTLHNTTAESLAATTTVAVTVDTKALYNAGKLKSDCSDLRVLYQPNSTTNVDITRHLVYPAGTDCTTSETTKVYFALQGTLGNGARSIDYYMYYGNPASTAPTNTDAAFNIGSKQALLVCPFNGTTTCAAGETPSTESGAVRYGGAKSALSITQATDVTSVNSIANTGTFTYEAWIYRRVGNHYDTVITNGSHQWLVGLDMDGYIGLAYYTPAWAVHDWRSNSNPIQNNTWNHVVVQYTWQSGSSIKAFVNGVEVTGSWTSGDGNAAPLANAGAFLVGRTMFGGGGYRFHGTIDEVRISNVARYTSNFTPQTTPFVRDENTVLLYHFDENGDDPRNTGKALDDSGNNNHGTITGAKYVAGLVGVDNGTTDTGNVPSQAYAGHEGIFIEEGTTNKVTNPSFEHSTYNTNWSAPSSFNYDSSADTFTAGMAKRNSSGPFAAGVYSQGNIDVTGTSDVVAYGAGTLIGANFWPTQDTDQGSLVMWITPEWNGNDGLSHTLLYPISNGPIFLQKTSTGFLQAGWRARASMTAVDVSSWTAGNTYLVVLRWDNKNPISGSNYFSITANNSTSYGITAGNYGINAPSTFYIGSGGNSSGTYPSNAIIEGATFYRRVLYDGTTGTDVGNGDELTAIYNSGTGKDPALVTGSWDVTFALPTNASTGALSTGTGNAWTHPHASNLLYTSGTNTGGFMMNGTYTSDGWANEGTPSSVAALDTAEKIYPGGYKVTSDAANEGIYYSKSVSAGDDWVIRAVGHSDGTCNPKVVLYNQTGSAEIGSLAGSTSSTRTSPNVYLFTGEAPAGMSELRVKLINTATSGTCYWHQVELLSNSINNPSLETGSGDPWIPTSWNNQNMEAGDSTQETSDVVSGSSAVKFPSITTAEGIFTNSISLSTSNYYGMGGWVKVASGNITLGSHGTINLKAQAENPVSSTPAQQSFTSSSWSHLAAVGRADWTTQNIGIKAATDSTNVFADDVYLIPLTAVSLTVTPSSEANSTETSGLRVDGTDTLTQTISNISATSGIIQFKFTPRHSSSTARLFGNTTPHLLSLYGDASNYINLYQGGTSQLTLTFNDGDGVHTATWDTLSFTAGTTYGIKIVYTADKMSVFVDNIERITIAQPVSFATVPTTAYFGSDNTGAQQYDLTVNSFGTMAPTENTAASYTKFGSKALKLVNSAVGPMEYVTNIDPDSTATHTLSAYVYDGTTGNVGGTVSSSIAQLVFGGSIVSTTYTDMGGGWWRLTYSGASTDASLAYGVSAAAGKTLYIDGVQLETKSLATSYTDGSLTSDAGGADTYFWDDDCDGTLDAGEDEAADQNSTCSSRKSTDLRYLTTDNFSQTNGSLSFWVKFNVNHNDLPANVGYALFSNWVFYNSSVQQLTIQYNRWANVFELIKTSDGTNYTTSVNKTFSKNEWLHVTATWDTTNGTALYVNAGTPGTNANTAAPAAAENYIHIGSNINGINHPQSIVSDFRIYNSPLTSAEVTDLYYSGLIAHSQKYEIDKFSGEEGPAAIWHFDESNGTTAYDSSPNRHNLTVSGATWDIRSAGNSGKRINNLKFDGTDDYASISANLARNLNFGSESFSLSGWFRHSSTQSDIDTIISKYGSAGYKVYMNSSGYICFGIDDDSTWGPDDSACSSATQGSYADSKWHHFEAVKNGTTNITLYIDGSQVAQTIVTANGSLSSGSALVVGADTNSSNYWTGNLDEIMMYPYARTTEQVATDHAGGQTGAYIGANLNGFVNDGLVGYWKMDEAGDSTRMDSSGNGNNLTQSEGDVIDAATGKFGNAADFENSSSEEETLLISDASQTGLDITGPMTISAWIKAESLPAGMYPIVSKWYANGGQRSYQLILNGNFAQFYLSSDGSSSATYATTDYQIASVGTWYHLVGSYDGNQMSVYVNGELKTNGANNPLSYSSSVFNSNANFRVGGGDSYAAFDGLIDESRVYNRALSPAEILDLYKWGPGPSLHYTFDEGTGTGADAVKDSSGNNYHGTTTSVSESAWVEGKYGKALDLSSTNDFITATSENADFSMNLFTASAWIYRTLDSGQDELIMSNNDAGSDGWSIMVESFADKADCYFNDTHIVGATALQTNRWYYITCTSDGVNARVYVNGKLDGTSSTLSGSISESTDFRVGGLSFSSTSYFTGKVDEVRVYNYARSVQQIVEDMNAGHPIGGSPISSKLLHLTFDEGYGDTAYDTGFGGNNGNLAGSGTTCPQTADSACPTYMDGKYGKALNFDVSGTTDDFVDVGSPASLDDILTKDGGLTVSTWIKTPANWTTPSINQQAHFVSKAAIVNGGWYLYNQWNGKPTFYVNFGTTDAYARGSDVLANNTWYHLTATIDNVTKVPRIYVNGIEVNYSGTNGEQVTGSGTYQTDASYDLLIGKRSDNWADGYYHGGIDEVQIYNTALTPEQINLIYNANASASLGNPTTNSEASTLSDGAGNPPIAHWTLNEKSGIYANDTSGNSNTGTLGEDGAGDDLPLWRDSAYCKSGACLEFDGNNDKIIKDSFTSITNYPFTISAWIKKPVASSAIVGGLFDSTVNEDDFYEISINVSGNVQLTTRNGDSTYTTLSNIFVSDNTWHHITGVFVSEAQRNIYVDGVYKGTNSSSVPFISNINRIGLGARLDSSPNGSFGGLIDDFKIYNYARTPAQIAYDYNRGAPVGHWKFDECTGTQVYDFSGNARHATIEVVSNGNTAVGTCGSGVSTHFWNDGTQGKYNASAGLDGQDDYVSLPAATELDFTQYNPTVAMWFKTSANYSAAITLVGDYADGLVMSWAMGISTSNTVFATQRDQGTDVLSATGTKTVNDGQWHHIAYVKTGATTFDLYLDGMLEAQGSNAAYNNSSLVGGVLPNIGRNSGYNNGFFNGQIDDVRIYNYPLSATQIKTVMNNGAFRFGP